ncbi:uncharacterized protein LOC135490899 [Lineus longissimus]|uniref:uncharacterized protein LOC135490899 n=1 Tax=Lineus longissimus TaxID=88925 RepID=UPI00315CFFFC
MSTLISVLLLCLVCGQSYGFLGGLFKDPPVTVSEVDPVKYAGRWYQIYGNLLTQYLFTRNAFCVTADYGLLADGTGISVLNAGRKKSATGVLFNITGTATYTNQVGQLDLQLAGVPVTGSYWITKLGPVNGDGLYEYSVVTDSKRVNLYVLARDPVSFKASYDAEVLQFLANDSFDSFFNKPIGVYQESDCQYAPLPEA